MTGELPLPLAEIFTAAGAAMWGAALTGVVELLKRAVPFIPETGRGVLYTVMILAALLVGAAIIDARPAITGTSIVGIVLTWVAVVTASAGGYEIVSKAGRVVQATTNPTGPDAPGPVSG